MSQTANSSRTEVHEFDARLKGVDVRCVVEDIGDGHIAIHVEVSGDNVDQGLSRISRFSGYCQRSLVLRAEGDEVSWAAVLASYFGFGLIVEFEDHRNVVMPPPEFDHTSHHGARATFLARIQEELSRN